MNGALMIRVEKMFKEMEIYEAEPELLAEPLGGTHDDAGSIAADVQAKQDTGSSVGVEQQAQGGAGNAQVRTQLQQLQARVMPYCC